jgi:hypothetical protein
MATKPRVFSLTHELDDQAGQWTSRKKLGGIRRILILPVQIEPGRARLLRVITLNLTGSGSERPMQGCFFTRSRTCLGTCS